MAPKANWNYPTTIWAGPGRVAELPAACKRLGIARPLLVTDKGLAATAMVRAALAATGAALFADVRGNPTGSNVAAGVAALKAGGHDGVIAFGGGSGLDAAKAIALMAGQTQPLWDFEDVGDNFKRVDPAGMLPVVAVPTTSGTGSETGRASVITDEAAHVKKIIFHPKMMPGIVILDPELTVGLPANLTAATGIDAFVHCFEAFCAPGFHPMAEGIALEGMRLVKDWLPRAFANGADIEARAQMQAAASMGAVAFQKGLGGVHALAHPIGAVFDTHHGLTNAVLLPYVMQRNRAAITGRMGRLARTLDLAASAKQAGDFDAVLAWVLEFRAKLAIPPALAALGLDAARADEIGAMAAVDPSADGNPCPLDATDYAEIYRAAIAGKI
ncbi:MAG: iron-containing alcohol dehydrogenase [Magnetospirillum sp.]|nr:iron-containing alcohol dehydrogenase [Magnetospirillum sp.]